MAIAGIASAPVFLSLAVLITVGICFEIEHTASSHFLLSKLFLDILVSLPLHIIFRIFLFVSIEYLAGILKEVALNL
jgi:hypothetical protein